jgi:drug/metabolite transporter (DMT)-like permease
MGNRNWRARILPTLMMAGVVSLLLSLLLGGFIFYQWVLGFEATAASLVLLAFYLRNRRNTRKSQWPPLLPLAVIGAAGGAKSFYVATGKETPWLVIVILLAAVFWFAVSSWLILHRRRPVRCK